MVHPWVLPYCQWAQNWKERLHSTRTLWRCAVAIALKGLAISLFSGKEKIIIFYFLIFFCGFPISFTSLLFIPWKLSFWRCAVAVHSIKLSSFHNFVFPYSVSFFICRPVRSIRQRLRRPYDSYDESSLDGFNVDGSVSSLLSLIIVVLL
jgi:hypothetical protein